MKLKENGVYILKEEFFEKYKDKYLSQNRGQGRPFYYVFSEHIKKNLHFEAPNSVNIKKLISLLQAEFISDISNKDIE